MTMLRRKMNLLLLAVALLSGCVANVHVDEQFPSVVAAPRDLGAALIMDREFQNLQVEPTENTTIQLGAAQVELLTKAFEGLFARVAVVDSREKVPPGTDLVITPSVLQVQLSTPSESYLNVYEVWIKYRLAIEAADGTAVDDWFLPAYGKTPDSTLLSRSRAVETATIVALRDAGAKLILDFYRIPAVNGWMREQGHLQEASP
jgi:hypothetical protein